MLLHALLSSPSHVFSQDERETLLRGLNSYRASMNLPNLSENRNGNCFANELANQLKDQRCSNIPGADTFPGMEPQFSNYRELLRNCHLNITTTRDGAIMPICVPDLDPNLVLTNYTNSIYREYLNDNAYTGAGIGSGGDWTVVVLTKNTVGGSFASHAANPLFLLRLTDNLNSLIRVLLLLLLI